MTYLMSHVTILNHIVGCSKRVIIWFVAKPCPFATLTKCEHLGSFLFLQKKEWGKGEFSKLHELPYFIGNISVLKFSGKMIFIPVPYMSYIYSCSSNDTVVVANCQLGRSQRGRSNKTQFVGHFFKLFDITVK